MDLSLSAGNPPARLLQDVIRIAGEASNAILQVYNSDFAITQKDDDSPLTAADLASHETIVHGLTSITPGIPILSEESASLPWSERKKWQTYWLVDPLDGTREFIKRNGEFTVNIALIHDHRPVLGVVHVPVSHCCYYATVTTGAFKQLNGSVTALHVRKTRPDHFTIAGSRSHGSEQQKRFIDSLGPNTETVIVGSSLKFCLLAEGILDLYPRFGPTSEWDSAAAQCVVEQAGGKVTDLQFRSLHYNTKDSLLNPDFLVIADPQFDWNSRLQKVL
jgi:3'(2'), 5'-bisphosphate nucleotidase